MNVTFWHGIQDAQAAAKAIRLAHENKRPMKEVIEIQHFIYGQASLSEKEAFLEALKIELPAAVRYFQ